MSVGDLRALVLEANFAAHGVPAVVELLNGDRLAATVIWMTTAADGMPVGTQLQRRDAIHTLAVQRAEVPSLPRGARITAAEPTGDGVARVWVVESHERTEADQHRVVVVSDPVLNED